MSASERGKRPVRTYTGAVKRALSDTLEDQENKRRRVDRPPLVTVTKPKLGGKLDNWIRRPTPAPLASSSSCPTSDVASFSDTADVDATPPSSPPEIGLQDPFEDCQYTIEPARRPLAPIEPNGEESRIARSKVVKAQLVQMQINLGSDLQRTCRDCGMAYVKANLEDMALHDKFHAKNAQGVDLGKAFRESAETRAVDRLKSGAVIVVVDARCKSFERRKAREVLDLVQTELGAVDIPDKDLWANDDDQGPQHRCFLYIMGSRCVGLCLAKSVQEAYPTVEDPDRLSNEEPDETIHISNTPVEARLGISRIWTSKSHRRTGVAQDLLTSAARSFSPKSSTPRRQVAFSQPTSSGARLARRWFGKHVGWSVYLD